jgi:uncharacterized membrane protein YagU involved in acid resistance
MSPSRVVTDAVLAVSAGYAGTKAMEQFNLRTYDLESEEDREREEAVRPGPPPQLAAEQLASRVLGIDLDEDQAMKAGMVFHQLTGLSWTPVYLLLRRTLGWRPVAAGLATGASMSLIVDETLTPAIGASAPNPEYPVSTHVRAFVAHLVYGLTVAAVVETGWKLLGRR